MVGGGQHGLTIGLRHETGGHAQGRQAHDHERVARDVVVDEDASGLEVCKVRHLSVEGQLTARHEHELTGQSVRVLLLESFHVVFGGDSTVNVLVVASGQLGDVSDLVAVLRARTLVGDVSSSRLEAVGLKHVIEGGHGNHGGVGSGFVQGRGVRVGGVGQVLTRIVAVAGREFVTGGRVDCDTLLLQRLEDSRVDAVGIVVHAGRLAERKIHDIGAQDGHVIQGGQQRGVRDTAAVTLNLRDDDLRVGGHAHDFTGVTRGDTGDVRAVGTCRGRVGVIVRVIVGEGELFGDVGTRLARTQLSGQGGNLSRIQGGSPRQGTGEGRVGHVHARVDDGNDLALTLLGHLVGVHDELGAQVVGILARQARSRETALGLGRQIISVGRRIIVNVDLAFQERGLHAAHAADRVERPGGSLQRESAEGVGVLAAHLGGGTRVNPSHGLVHGGEGGSAVGAARQLDDDADDARGVLSSGGLGRRSGRGLSVLRGQCGVDVADRNDRFGRGRRGLWGDGGGGGRCRKGSRSRDREHARPSERKQRHWFLRCHSRKTPMC